MARKSKPIDRLTQSDLRNFPVWEFADDEESLPGHDETWVRPLHSKSVPTGNGSINVAARLTTRTGQVFNGVAAVDTSATPPIVFGAVILFDRQYLPLPIQNAIGGGAMLGRLSTALGLAAQDIFPVQVQLAVPVHGSKDLLTHVLAA